MDLSIIIVSYNTKGLTTDCIKSVCKNTQGISYEIIVIDNASIDGSVRAIKQISKSCNAKIDVILNRENIGFGRANNQGMEKALGEYILLLNSDTLIHDNVLAEMVGWLKTHKKIGIASCALLNKDGTMQGTGGYFPTLLRVFSWMTIQDIPLVDKLIKPFHPMKSMSFKKGDSFYNNEKELDWVTGAFFLMSREVFQKVGFFDQKYFMYTEEVDYCYRAKNLGWLISYNPKWTITHYGGASGKAWSFITPEFNGVKRFYNKFYPSWQYPVLRLLLKIGSLGRLIIFGVLRGKEAALAYAKAFEVA